MPSVVHVVVTRSFAGVERYVAGVARAVAERGWSVTVVGGDGAHVREIAGPEVRWLPGGTVVAAALSLVAAGRQDICHAHMTAGELAAVGTRSVHRAPVVSTRHFATRRGSTVWGRVAAKAIAGRLARELAVSEFVSERLERAPDAVVRNGVPPARARWGAASRTVLVLQRLESEKETRLALEAWRLSRLAEEGWSLRIVGDGAERDVLEDLAAADLVPGVTFAGWVESVDSELSAAGVLLAPCRADAFGLSVVEAMAAGVPVVAAAAGGHLETVGKVPGAALFAPGDARAAAEALRRLAGDAVREDLSRAGRRLVEEELSLARHVDELLAQYEVAAC